MPSPADTSAFIQGDDEYQYLWYMLQKLQTRYHAIECHFQDMKSILLGAIRDAEDKQRWDNTLGGLSDFWKREELGKRRWTSETIQHRTFERFSQTVRAAYVLFEVRREFVESGLVTYQTMAERMLRIGRLMAAESPHQGIHQQLPSLQREITHALNIWEEVKFTLRVEGAEQESDTSKLQLQAWYFRPATMSDLPPETAATGCSILECLGFSAHSSAPFTCQPPLCSTVATGSSCAYAPDRTRLNDNDLQERHEDYDATALKCALRKGYFPSVTLC